MKNPESPRSWFASPRHAIPLLILLLLGTVVTIVEISNATAATDLSLVAGTDNNCVTPPVYPCASVTVSGTGTQATVGIVFFASNVLSPQPATYYTDLLRIHDSGSVYYVIDTVDVSNITGAAYLGRITVYYCGAQTDDPADSASCANFNMTSSSGGRILRADVLPGSIAPGGNGFIEAAAFASPTAAPSDEVTFSLTIVSSLFAGTPVPPAIFPQQPALQSNCDSAFEEGACYSGATCNWSLCGVVIAIYKQDPESSPPSGMAAPMYFDVEFIGYSGRGTATVSVNDSRVQAGSEICYWSGSNWIWGVTTFTPPHTVSATIPISALIGTPIAVGFAPAATTTTTVTSTATQTGTVTVTSTSVLTSNTTQTSTVTATSIATSTTTSTSTSTSIASQTTTATQTATVTSTAITTATSSTTSTATRTTTVTSTTTSTAKQVAPAWTGIDLALLLALAILILLLLLILAASRRRRKGEETPSTG